MCSTKADLVVVAVVEVDAEVHADLDAEDVAFAFALFVKWLCEATDCIEGNRLVDSGHEEDKCNCMPSTMGNSECDGIESQCIDGPESGWESNEVIENPAQPNRRITARAARVSEHTQATPMDKTAFCLSAGV